MKKAITFSTLALACSTTCPNVYKVADLNTCEKVEKHFGLSRIELHRLNEELHCGLPLPRGKEVCVGKEAPKPCKRFYTVDEFATSWQISDTFNITQEQLNKMNPNLIWKSGRLADGTKVCVSEEELKSCTQRYTLQREKEDIRIGCEYIEQQFGLNRGDLVRVNENLDCWNLTNICLSVEDPKPCTHIYKVSEFTKIQQILNAFELQEHEFNRMNVDLNFSEYYNDKWGRTLLKYKDLEAGTEVCVSQGELKACPYTYTVGRYDTCEKIEKRWGMSPSALHKLNSKLDCSKNLTQGQGVCVSHEILIDCARKYKIFEFNTCKQVEEVFEVKHEELLRLNPGLECNFVLRKDSEVCLREFETISQ